MSPKSLIIVNWLCMYGSDSSKSTKPISAPGPFGDYKYLSLAYGMDRKICHEGHRSASRGKPRDAEQ